MMAKITEQTFELKKEHTYIQLNNLLQVLQIAQTGGHAKLIIQNGDVMLNGIIETRVRKKLIPGNVVLVGNQSITII